MTLRPMTMEDAKDMFRWKNDPQTREFAIKTQDEITWASHYTWLEKNVHLFQVIEEVGNRKIGAVRIEDITISPPPGYIKLVNGPELEISIWIDEKFRKCGWGTEAIKKVRKHYMTAKIVVGNIPSMRAFIKAGFLPDKLVDNKYYIFVYKAEMYAE